MQPDFTAHRHPVLAVACPDCKKPVGVWCARPGNHQATDLHRSRRVAADCLFVTFHGADASIERSGTGWAIDPLGRAERNRVERRSGVPGELFS